MSERVKAALTVAGIVAGAAFLLRVYGHTAADQLPTPLYEECQRQCGPLGVVHVEPHACMGDDSPRCGGSCTCGFADGGSR